MAHILGFFKFLLTKFFSRVSMLLSDIFWIYIYIGMPEWRFMFLFSRFSSICLFWCSVKFMPPGECRCWYVVTSAMVSCTSSWTHPHTRWQWFIFFVTYCTSLCSVFYNFHNAPSRWIHTWPITNWCQNSLGPFQSIQHDSIQHCRKSSSVEWS